MTWHQLVFLVLSCGVLAACSRQEGKDPQPETPDGPYAFNIPSYFSRNIRIPDDNPTTIKGVELGRMLFYEKKLSGDNSMSCASCHQQKAAFTDPGKRFSRGVTGQEGTRNTMSLANLLWVNRFFWNGRSTSLEEQALQPIEDPVELHQSLEAAVAKLQATDIYPPQFKQVFGSELITPETIAKALAQFQRTLISANSRYDQYLRGEYQPSSLELQGIRLFFTHPIPQADLRGGNCGDCHLGPLTNGDPFQFRGFHNNGLDTDATMAAGLQAVTGNTFDKGKFRAPTLRNIALTAPYMHDGRFSSLEEVLEHYDQHIRMSSTLDPLIIEASNEILNPGDPVKLYLTPREKEAILAFLHMLTDSTFISNPAFADPFVR